jgi:hypothetical protein
MKKIAFLISLLLPVLAGAQSYSINWHKIAGGGGNSSGTNGANVYSVSGTVGQHDASPAMSSGNYSVTGGFWSLISVEQTPGAPILSVLLSGTSVIVWWPTPATSYTLQQTPKLAPPDWITSSYTVSTNAGTNSITIPSPAGDLYFRLFH